MGPRRHPSRPDYDLLQPKPDWTPEERAAYAAATTSPIDPPSIYSPLLRRIRATAGPGLINSTSAWHAVGSDVRLETTDGPPCPDLIRLLGDGPTGIGWEVEYKRCTCLCDHTHADVGCSIDFRDPTTGRSVYYSNAKWGRTLDDRRRERVAEMNRRLTPAGTGLTEPAQARGPHSAVRRSSFRWAMA